MLIAAVENNNLSQESYKLAAARLQGEIERMQWVERSTAIRADWEVPSRYLRWWFE